MVYLQSSISLCKPVDHQTPKSLMANSGSSISHRRTPNSVNSPQVPTCERSHWTVVEVVLFIAVIGACLFLFIPFIHYLITGSIKIFWTILNVVKEEISLAPSIYICIGLGFSLAALAIWGFVACTSSKCGNPECMGLRKAAEFDIQLESEDRMKNSPYDVVKKGLFELPRDHHRELEAELKKVAPDNGRAILILRARCGCSVGKLEVPGPKKQPKKMKK